VTWFNGLEHIVRENEPMTGWNWFRLGGAAEFFAEPTSVKELTEILKRTHAGGISVRLLGAGSNILVRDEGVAGVVIHLSAPAFCDISVDGQQITAGGGAKLNHVVSTAAREGLSGFEALVGIPSTIGGALRRNAIGHGAAIGQWANRVSVLTRGGEQVTLQRGDLRFGHRESNLDDLIITEGVFLLERGDTLKVTRQMQKLWIMKQASQPSGDLGHGQAFVDPLGLAASEIIEQAGLKGAQVGGASISEGDANLIVVDHGTSSADVLALIELVREQVFERLGNGLVPEIEVW
jgi:UDP-N-acetylmuramate dehydrogenase